MKKLFVLIISVLSVFLAQAQFSVNSSGKASVGTYKYQSNLPDFPDTEINPFAIVNPLPTYGDTTVMLNIYHCFGDPSMEMRTEVPTTFDNLEIAKDDNIVCIDLGNDIANITFYNKNDNTVQSFRGKTAIYDISSGNIAICISAHNKIPVIIEPEQLNFDKIIGTKFIQNTIVSDSRLYKSNTLKIGNDVTTKKPEGPVSFESGSFTTIEAKSVVIESNTIIKKGAAFNITTKNQ